MISYYHISFDNFSKSTLPDTVRCYQVASVVLFGLYYEISIAEI